MLERATGPDFHRDPLRFLEESARSRPDAFWIPGRQLLLAEPDAAKRMLRNADGLYQERADFFRLRDGRTFGDRAAQLRLGRAARDLLRSRIASSSVELDSLIWEQLGPSSSWPDAGNWLVFRHLRPALLGPHRSPALQRLLEEIVSRAVLAGARERSSVFRRALFRRRAYGALGRALIAARESRSEQPLDVLDVLALEVGPGVSVSDLAEVFVSFVFATCGSIGFVLAWSIYFAGSDPEQPARDVPSVWRVREALRLGPVAWMLGSRPAREHSVAGVEVTPRDEVVACPYLAHRHPAHWEDPDLYRPERWADRRRPFGFLPFGWGPHKCPAATLSTDLVADLLDRLLSGYHLRVVAADLRPHVGTALAPPPFTLNLEPRTPLQNPTKGGE